MKFKKGSIQKPSLGEDYTEVVDQVKPNQSMSLQEILERFTRGEALQVGKPTFGDSHDDKDIPEMDYEKLPDLDITEKQEIIDQAKETAGKFKQQEERKAKAKREKAEAEAKKAEEERVQKAIAEGIAKGSSGK